MAGEDIIRISQEELRRLHIIRKYLEGSISEGDAAELMGISGRQARRLIKRAREEGDKGVIHRIKSNNRVPDEIWC